MKHLILSILFLFLATNVFATQETFLYTFSQETFTGTIATNQRETLLLHNRQFIINCTGTGDNKIDVSFVPNRGLRIIHKSGSPTFVIYTKTSDETLTASITLETTASSTNITFNKPNESFPSVPYDAYKGTNTITHTYSGNTLGPKINILLGPSDTIFIKSIEFTFDIQSTTSSTINLHNGSNTIGSYSVSSSDEFPISLPSVIPSDPRFSFFGWTTNSTISLSDSPTAPSEITTSITETPSSATTDLYPIFAHYRQNSFPEIITIIPDSNNKDHLFIPFPLSDFQAIASDALLASLHVHIKESSHNTMPTTFSFSSPTNKTDIIATFADTHIEQFYPLTINTFIPIGLTGTIGIHRKGDPLTVDSIVAITYPNPEPRYYTSIPATTPDNDLTINLSDPVNVTTSLTATDAVTYTMTIDDSRFYFLSLPFAAPFNNTTITPITGPHPRTYYYGATDDAFLGDYVISDYDETTHSWHDLTKTELETNGFQPNHGYTIGLTQPGTKATFTFRTANAPITISPSQPETIIQTPITNPSDKRNAGWNLIGNPYVTPLDPTQVCTEQGLTLNYILIPNDNNSYDIVSQYSEEEIPIIPPFTSFFIQSTTPTTIINPQAANDKPATRRQTTTPLYHFNIVCITADSTKSVLTILSNDSLTDDYETSFDLLSLSPETDITHDGLAIYASSIQPGDTIPINIPTSDATLSLGHNILIPENWTIEILPDIPAVTIIDNTPASLDNIDETPDTPIQIFTIDGRLIFTGNTMPTNLTPATYIIRTPRKTQKILIK